MKLWPFKKQRAPVMPAQKKSMSYLMLGGSATRFTHDARAYAAEGYCANAVAFTCINKIASSVSSLDIKLMQQNGDEVEQIKDHPILDLLWTPNPRMSWQEFVESITSWKLIAGNSYIVRNGLSDAYKKRQPPTELNILHTPDVKAEKGAGNIPRHYEYRPNSESHIIYPVDQLTGKSNVLHLRTFNPQSTWVGMSPMQPSAYSVDIFNEGQNYNKALVQNSGRPSGALKVVGADGQPQDLTDEQFRRLKEEIDSQYTGSGNAGRPLILEGGLDWVEMSMSMKDMDFKESILVNARWIAGCFGVPPQLANIPGESTFANWEQAQESFWGDTVLMHGKSIINALNRWLIPQFGDESLYLCIDEDSIPALEARRKRLSDRVGESTFMTTNEKRAVMGMDDVDGGDSVLIDAGKIPLDLVDSVELNEVGTTNA